MKKKFHVYGNVEVTYVATVEAETADEAMEIAEDLDISDFDKCEPDGDFNIYSAQEV